MRKSPLTGEEINEIQNWTETDYPSLLWKKEGKEKGDERKQN